MKYADIIEFIESEVGSQVRLRMDCETEDIVAECECCEGARRSGADDRDIRVQPRG